MERTRPLTPQASPTLGVTYAEVRWWAVFLNLFTASDLAMSMGVDLSVASNGIKALLYHGICYEVGDELPGPFGMEPLVGHVPLPPGPKRAFTYPPEWRTCEIELLSPRGMPIRVSAGEKAGKRARSTPGIRHKILLRDKRYEEQEAARAKRRAANAIKATKEPKWKRSRGGSVLAQVDW